MKYFLFLFLLAIATSCSTVNVPPYIQDKHPYTKTLQSNYNKVLLTTKKILAQEKWTITKEADPTVYEKGKELDVSNAKQTLIFARTVEKSLVGTGKYAQLNVYLRTVDEINTEIEIRYLVVNSALVKEFYDYRNDKLINNLIEKINQQLKK